MYGKAINFCILTMYPATLLKLLKFLKILLFFVSSPDYLNDLRGHNDDEFIAPWEFYGSSVCGKQYGFVSLLGNECIT